MDKVSILVNKVKTMAMDKPELYAIIAILSILFLIVIFKSESFEALDESIQNLAEYPGIFANAVVPGFIKDAVYENIFQKPTQQVVPDAEPITQLELPASSTMVAIDIGNGMAVNAQVQVPAQTVSATAEPVILPKKVETDTLVVNQTVQIPAQQGIIPVKVEGSDSVVPVPVSIPSQMVDITEQSAHIPVMEPFTM